MSGAEVNLATRRSEEPRGRWENRCDYAYAMGFQKTLVCDRPDEHKGLHSGRIIQWEANGSAIVLGYGRR